MQKNQDLLEFAVEIAHQAGKLITDYFYTADRSDVRTKHDSTPVTDADIRVNQLVIDKLKAVYPEHGVLGEEQSHEAGRRNLWVCDPIDGTQALAHGVPTAMFSLAYVVDGVPEAAVMFDPFQNQIYTALRGGGAFCNGKPVHVSHMQTLKGATLTSSGSYKQLKERRVVYDWLESNGASFMTVPGNVFRSGLVAHGYMDGSLFPGRSAHDVAAAALIITEAGGKVTDLDGNDQRYDQPIRGAIISNGHLHDSLIKAVAALGSDQFLGY